MTAIADPCDSMKLLLKNNLGLYGLIEGILLLYNCEILMKGIRNVKAPKIKSVEGDHRIS
jgi:hypothetical protein